MGLYDEAIGELRVAGKDPRRAGACLVLEGVCLREKGDAEAAETVLRSVLSNRGARPEESAAAGYELAVLLESLGRSAEAEELLRHVVSTAPDFADAAAKLRQLQGGA
jgi:hypothetical protein